MDRTWRTTAFELAALLIVLVFALGVWPTPLSERVPLWFRLVLAPVIWWCLLLVMDALAPRNSWERWRRAAIAEACCPSCGYSLDGCPEQPDGFRVCAECGAAWAARA